MRLALLGGSFNPIHNGHLYLADSALTVFGFDRLLLIPAGISPFKRHPPEGDEEALVGETARDTEICPAGVSAADRLDMILASIPADPRIGVDDLELRRGGVSYTIDTLEEIVRRYRPGEKPALILGDDLAANFSGWRRAGEIARKADLILARRMDTPEGSFPYPHRRLDNEVMELSSAMVRERIGRGEAWRYLVPQGARRIIEDRGLYGDGKNGPREKGITADLTARVEDTVRGNLSPARFLHSRNTALMARDLALRWGLDGDAAYLAGTAHDMAKSMDAEELRALARRDPRRGELSRLERKKPSLLHGRAAAVLLWERFGIHNGEVLEAVSVHTAGKAGMGKLAQAVFIADKLEFSRSGVPPRLRELAYGSARAEELLQAVVENSVAYLREAGLEPAEETLELLENAGRGPAGSEP
ncbi:MAG: nicotinate (nicotinamide) nucleotide adenylyltransferase [Treponema sp.]|nr:nicotinate (nicotinamide) nucleotide adenylyltransferase [Treponema sp.]